MNNYEYYIKVENLFLRRFAYESYDKELIIEFTNKYDESFKLDEISAKFISNTLKTELNVDSEVYMI